MSGVVISAAGTGAGKTTLARALCVALRRAGRRVQPYKIGPDYIDARLAARAAGRPCYNVDLWLDGEDGARAHVAGTRGDADACVFEGMMGLYDGDDEGETSTAALAVALDVPVLLVLDGWSASQTAGAIALGLRSFDPRVRFAGAVLNRCGGPAHARAVRTSCRTAGVEVLAEIPADPALASAERALGLDPDDAGRSWEAIERLGERLAAAVDLDALAGPAIPAREPPSSAALPLRARIAFAHDDAFWFTYPETLLALRAAGAEPVPFSPLNDAALPPCDGLWLGGGYPELHAAALAANTAMRAAVRDAVRGGLPTYAECGGMMYLAETLETPSGRFAMAGAIAGAAACADPRLTIGYRTARVATPSPFDPGGATVRGYEFRTASAALAGPPAYAFEGGATDGVAGPALLATFVHRHFRVGDPALARFVAACAG